MIKLFLVALIGVSVGVVVSWFSAYCYYKDELEIMQERVEVRDRQLYENANLVEAQKNYIDKLRDLVKGMEDDGK